MDAAVPAAVCPRSRYIHSAVGCNEVWLLRAYLFDSQIGKPISRCAQPGLDDRLCCVNRRLLMAASKMCVQHFFYNRHLPIAERQQQPNLEQGLLLAPRLIPAEGG